MTDKGIQFTRKVGEFGTQQVLGTRIAVAAPSDAQWGNQPQVGRGRGFGGPIELKPNDKPAFPNPLEDFDKARKGIEHGKVETVDYDSKSVGNKRKAIVYMLSGYSADTKCIVLYLLNGIGSDEDEWCRGGHPEIILDNLITDKKAVPMIIVMPNGRAQPDDRPGTNAMASAPAFGRFDKDLLGDLIPFIESKYAVKKDPESRALAVGAFDGWRPVVEFRSREPQPLRVGRRVLVRAKHKTGGGTCSRSGEGEKAIEAALTFLWQQRRPDSRKPGRSCVLEREGSAAHLACGRTCARLPALEEGTLQFRATDL